HRLTMTEKKPTYAGAKLWNALPEHLRKTEKQQFVRRLKNWLLEHPFYQLKEFYEWTNNNESLTLDGVKVSPPLNPSPKGAVIYDECGAVYDGMYL
ncbi:hypothetical protein J6590_103980, partial [Homalodisca vitripennis]